MIKMMMVKAAAFAAAMMAAATMITAAAPAPASAAESQTSVTTERQASKAMSRTFTLDDIDTTVYGYSQPVTIVNSTGKAIKCIYIAPSAVSDWGNDILGDAVMTENDVETCCFTAYGNYTKYDVRCDYFDGTQNCCYNYDFSNVPIDGFVLEIGNGCVNIY